MNGKGNILFCGVGGQGILLASEVTAYSLLAAGMEVRKSEVHGMAQRGGSVTAHLRYGGKVYSPLISPGEADIVVAFEMMEAVRYLPYMHSGSKVIVNTHKIYPPVVATGKMVYPENVLDELTSRDIHVRELNAFDIANGVGEVRAVNIVMVGVLSTYLPVDEQVYVDVMHERIPERFRDVNIRAFQEGRKTAAL
ncbi:MAG: indolepyruvate oxidoreductase subunit beta [Desulfobulbaceae bacterium]|jgi:indolepyruvate ferredoxin oxidoreductase beta subunit|nr:indolepyruvate oxidoreductase subunit beta [Desulfobulbaceae bacterium]MDH3782440.1 indolepyruvate oxidoreductase subunit beta [Desulfobulbaceae bacterium]HKJ15531.1 indolepyruvate oxidoreductase subunit beta [Desulfobulbales bacterium]